ncbi:MAG: hypothetical protein AVDCRST_MAG18-2012 [uncultured Thermomicrobiales bacterium]|uniref:Uncharacterized protein n=1 Tax=uncultured Thermomicrobiales bacterium TaxID=1645740 RepID=A0A6J4V7S6_9BACT|nr:MAG: hypothetical protein AVDCRST_MAG18-2012 [uncultured Thermomicrobiales bacterium]
MKQGYSRRHRLGITIPPSGTSGGVPFDRAAYRARNLMEWLITWPPATRSGAENHRAMWVIVALVL